MVFKYWILKIYLNTFYRMLLFGYLVFKYREYLNILQH